MGEEMRADPVEIARAAQSYVDSSKELAAAVFALRADSMISPSDFGKVTPAAQLHQGYTGVAASAGTAVERVIGVLEVDNESLLQTSFAYRQADEQARRAQRGV